MSTIQLPGLIDVHTHLRVPGGEHKEDFTTGSAAALSGGITQILGMPNTSPPLATPEIFAETIQKVEADALCDIGLFAGASPKYVELLPQLADRAVALKIYLNDTFGDLRVDEVPVLARCFELWPRHKLIAMHAEKQSDKVPPGVPGLETSLALMCTAAVAGRLTLERIVALMATNPRHIFGIPEQSDTHIEVDLTTPFTMNNSRMRSKCGWTPFDGMSLVGQVKSVTLRGEVVFADGEILATPGSGRLIAT